MVNSSSDATVGAVAGTDVAGGCAADSGRPVHVMEAVEKLILLVSRHSIGT